MLRSITEYRHLDMGDMGDIMGWDRYLRRSVGNRLLLGRIDLGAPVFVKSGPDPPTAWSEVGPLV